MPQQTKPRYNKVRTDDGNGAFTLAYDGETFKQGACAGVDTEFFYPATEVFTNDDRHMLTKICSACPIVDMCREWGTVHERHGVWGGLLPIERERARKKLGWKLVDPVTGEPKNYKSYGGTRYDL